MSSDLNFLLDRKNSILSTNNHRRKETCSRETRAISLALSDNMTTIFASSSSSSVCLSRTSSSATSKLCLRRSKKWIPLSGEGGRRRTKTLRVWREINEHVTAVVDASFREEEDEEEDEEETEGLGGVVSDAAALEMYLRLESGKQRECVETFVSEEAREKTLSATSVVDVEERRGDEKNGNETITKSMKLREAERAADILRTHGLVFLKSVVPEETCDEILADLNAICDECKETYGDALRRTDVLLGVGDDNGDDSGDGKINGVKKALEFACKEEGGNIRNILSFVEDATEDAVLVELSVLATEKGADRQVLHPDVAYDAPHETLYSVFIALQDVTQDMGPTLFVLNSHDKQTHDQLPKTKWTEKEFDVLRTKRAVEALLKKGDAVLYNARAFHQGGENTSGRRALLTLTFLKPPVPPEPTRRNKECLWSIREDVFRRQITAKDLATGGE
jgi:ectoine hydroxylase-related dioxygenase (phytanoyl-CoA dioxygenase family)